MMTPRKIILHCSATPDGDAASWEAIRKFHTDIRGWSDIGYHYGIEEYENGLVVLRGRKPWVMGAHCRAGGRNRDSLGVCVVGEFDSNPPPEEKYNATIWLLSYLCFTFSIGSVYVHGHSEFEENKTCPGEMWDMDRTRADIARRIKHAPDLGNYLRVQ